MGVFLNAGYTYLERIQPQAAGQTLLAYLAGRYLHSSSEIWEARIQEGLVLLDGLPAKADAILRNGQMMSWTRPPWQEPEVPLHYDVLYVDEDLLAVAKPSGLPTMPAGGYMEHTLLHLVRQKFPEVSPIHRLGRGTSGVVLFARKAEMRSRLCGALREHRMTKLYRALVQGHPVEDAFTVDTPIGPIFHPRLGTLHAASPVGKASTSHVRVLERRDQESLVEVHIETGRPHQIRIHMASCGHPLVGDPLYGMGGGLAPGLDGSAALPGDEGYLLHAMSLSLVHPGTGKALEIRCEAPERLQMRSEHP